MDWLSQESHICLNPAFSEDQAQKWVGLLEDAPVRYSGHLFVLTSGTTAQSVQDFKWIALSKKAFLASAESVNRHLEATARDVWLHVLPDFHVGGLGIWARSFLSGSKVVQGSGPWNPEHFVAAVSEHRATLASLVPTQIFDLIQKNLSAPSSLRAILVGGGALSFSLYERAMDLGWPLLTTYGMTETCSQVATASLKSIEAFRGGRRSLPDLEILGHWEVESAECLRFRGPSLLTAAIYQQKVGEGHYERREELRKTEWWTSQDRGVVENRALKRTLKIFGRSGDFVKIGGESVDVGRLREIFDRVCLEYQVGEGVALLPVPDERLGHAMVLVAEKSVDSQVTESLMAAFNRNVLGFEKIRRSVAVDKIPRTDLGKIRTAQCLEMIYAGEHSPHLSLHQNS